MPRDLIIAIDGFYGRGGTERQILDIAAGMRQRGWRTTVLSRWPLDPHGEHWHSLNEASVEIAARGLARSGLWQRVLNRARMAAARGDNEKLERDAWCWQATQIARRAARAPVVVHEIPYFGRMPTAAVDAHKQLRLPVVQTILGTPRAPVTPAADWAILTTDGAPTILDGSTPTWIPCMTIETTSNHRPHRSASSGPIRLLFVGRIVHSKGLDLLLRALRSVPGVELTVVGDGPDLVERKLQAASLGGRVAFTGSLDRSAVFDEIAHGDVLVVPSRGDGVEFQEGMPTVIAEALSLNCPVLGTAVGGVRRVLDGPNAPGWLVPADDAEALSRQIAALTAQNIAERGAGARDVYEHLLRPDVVLGAYEDCYARAVSQAR